LAAVSRQPSEAAPCAVSVEALAVGIDGVRRGNLTGGTTCVPHRCSECVVAMLAAAMAAVQGGQTAASASAAGGG
jgi:hypothetical protein